MIHYTVQQGSTEWHGLRGVIPTASCFDRLITPAKWESTKGDTRRNYMLELLANRIFGLSPEDQVSTAAMAHGTEWEPIARAAYEFERGVEIQDGGFFTDDAGTYGASPDGLIGDDGLIEIKNPASPSGHLSAMLDAVAYSGYDQEWTAMAVTGSSITGFVRDHWIQVQGQLLVTGRSWCDLVSNFARLPMVVVRIYPNLTFQRYLFDALTEFCADLQATTEYAEANGWYRPQPAENRPDPLGITDEDVEAMIASRRTGAAA